MASEPQPRLNDNLDPLAAALSNLAPRSSELNRDRLMYEAGRSAALASITPNRSALRFWKITTSLSTLTAAFLAALTLPQLMEQPVEGPVPVRLTQQEASPSETQPASEPDSILVLSPRPGRTVRSGEMSYLDRRNLVIAHGIETLPTSRNSIDRTPNSSLPYRELRNSLDDLSEVGG